jgi:hypothetical protein
MKVPGLFCFLFGLAGFSACVQPVPKVKVSVTLAPPPPIDSVPMQLAPDAELKELKYVVGDTVTTKGIVYGYKISGDTTFVYLGAAYPNPQLTVLLIGSVKDVVADIDKKLVYVSGCVSKHRGKLEIAVTDSDHFGLKYLYWRREGK